MSDNESGWDRYWQAEEEHARIAWLRDDEVPEEPYTFWDALMAGDLL